MAFYDFMEWERLVEAAVKIDQRIFVVALLGGEAGVRSGEMTALEWTDVDARQRLLTIARSERKGHVPLPKGTTRRYMHLSPAASTRVDRNQASGHPQVPASQL